MYSEMLGSSWQNSPISRLQKAFWASAVLSLLQKDFNSETESQNPGHKTLVCWTSHVCQIQSPGTNAAASHPSHLAWGVSRQHTSAAYWHRCRIHLFVFPLVCKTGTLQAKGFWCMEMTCLRVVWSLLGLLMLTQTICGFVRQLVADKDMGQEMFSYSVRTGYCFV